MTPQPNARTQSNDTNTVWRLAKHLGPFTFLHSDLACEDLTYRLAAKLSVNIPDLIPVAFRAPIGDALEALLAYHTSFRNRLIPGLNFDLLDPATKDQVLSPDGSTVRNVLGALEDLVDNLLPTDYLPRALHSILVDREAHGQRFLIWDCTKLSWLHTATDGLRPSDIQILHLFTTTPDAMWTSEWNKLKVNTRSISIADPLALDDVITTIARELEATSHA